MLFYKRKNFDTKLNLIGLKGKSDTLQANTQLAMNTDETFLKLICSLDKTKYRITFRSTKMLSQSYFSWLNF